MGIVDTPDFDEVLDFYREDCSDFVFLGVTSRSLVGRKRRFGGTCCFRLQV